MRPDFTFRNPRRRAGGAPRSEAPRCTQDRGIRACNSICERELGHLQPERYPSTLELRREPTAVASVIQPEPASR
jgi:hypothetical protein